MYCLSGPWFYLWLFELLSNIFALWVICRTRSALCTLIDSRCLPLLLLLLYNMFFHFACYQVVVICVCFYLCIPVCLMHMYPDSVSSGYIWMNVCFRLDVWVCVNVHLCDRSILLLLSVLTAHLQLLLPPFTEIKSLFSQAAYWVKASKHRCSASGTDNMGLKDLLRPPAYTIKASVLALIWFTEGGQLGNRFYIELL